MSMPVEGPIRLLLIAPVKPGETNGGAIVLARHLCRDADLILHAAEPDPPRGTLWQRLSKSRFSALANDLAEMQPFRAHADDLATVREFAPHALVTLAHGGEYRRALGLARATGLPLLTFFHDHWPSMIRLTGWGRGVARRAFAKLARESAAALCVSQPMAEAIGNPPSARVLLPIPGPGTQFAERSQAGRLTVAYSGNLFDYAPAMGAIADLLLNDPAIALTIRGPNPNWSVQQLARLTDAGIYQPPLARADYEAWMMAQDAHLCALSFDPAMALRMRTSFPSKMLEMFRFGRPVVLWGPDHAAGVEWARQHDAALVVADPQPQALAAALRRLAEDEALYRHYRDAARRAADLTGHDRLQTQFRQHLAQVLAARG